MPPLGRAGVGVVVDGGENDHGDDGEGDDDHEEDHITTIMGLNYHGSGNG